MIDNFSLGLTHALMLYAAWRLLWMKRLNTEVPDDKLSRKGTHW